MVPEHVWCRNAAAFAPRLPKPPLLGFHNPKPEEQICYGMGQNARTETLRAVGDEVVERPGYGRGPQSADECTKVKPTVTAAKESQEKVPDGTRSKFSSMK